MIIVSQTSAMADKIINASVELAARKIELTNWKFEITGKSGTDDGY